MSEGNMSNHAKEVLDFIKGNFDSEMKERLSSAIDAKKIEIAQNVYVKSTN
jgi:hypothetical protein